MSTRVLVGARPVSVLCVGQATADHVLTIEGEIRIGHKHVATGHQRVGGGVAANAAVTIARLGGEAALMSCVGSDDAGAHLLAGLRCEQVATGLVRRIDDIPTPFSAVIVSPMGTRTIVNHTPSELFDRPPPAIDLDRLDAVLVDGRWPAATEAALRLACDRGVPGIVDVDRHIANDRDRRTVLELATHLVFGEDALAEYSGCRDPREGLHEASTHTAAHLAVTCGEHGVHWLDGATVRSMSSFEVDVVDTVAAGDVFHGAFALALGEGVDLAAALRFASAAAALKCTQPGARSGIPRRCDVDRFLAEPTRMRAS